MTHSILIFVHHEYEELELHYPRLRLMEAGYKVVLAGPEKNAEYRGKHGYSCRSDTQIASVAESDFIGVIVPGGFSPDKLRRDQKVLQLVRSFHEKGKFIASICHGGWVPISAKIVSGFRYTSTSAIKDDLINAGASWVDEPVVVDRHHITSRRPDDLPLFCSEILRFLSLI
ncbi:MAG: type 1 glutamine amidotransferase [Chlamydiales bacterium]|nr:type 1 glutamine amidotransferase [Chlamydiales bacterium]